MVADHQIVKNGQGKAKPRALEGARYAGLVNIRGTHTREIKAAVIDTSLARLVDAGYDVEKGRLPRTIRSDETENFTAVDAQVKRVQRHQSAETHGEAVAGEQGAHGLRPGK